MPFNRSKRVVNTMPASSNARLSVAPVVARFMIAVSLVALVAGCARLGQQPRNLDRGLFNPEKATAAEEYEGQHGGLAPDHEPSRSCPAPGAPNFIMPGPPKKGPSKRDMTMRYSPGDRFNITVPGMEEFTGDYVINADGRVILPFAGEIHAVATTNSELQKRIEGAYIKAGIFKREGLKLAVRPVQYAPINVYVQGAVFGPGRSVINNLKDSDKTEKYLTKIRRCAARALYPVGAAFGRRRAAGRRCFTHHLDTRFAADRARLARRVHRRRCRRYRARRRGSSVCAGGAVLSIRPRAPVADHDRRCAHSHVQFDPAGAPQCELGNHKDSTSLPYGVRFLQGLIVANCVGGARTSNAERHAVLISRNPKTQQTEVIQRSIEELVRSADRDSINPHLMPDDAIACYDSKVTEFREVMGTLGSALQNVTTAHTYKKW